MKKIVKSVVAAACAVAMAATMMGSFASTALAQSQPTTDTVTYGTTKDISINFDINGSAKNVTCSEVMVIGKNVTASNPRLTVNGSKGTVTVTVKGVDADYGRVRYTTVSPCIVIDGTAYNGKVIANVRCLRAPQTITCTQKFSVKRSTIKKKKVSFKLKPKATSGGAVYIAEKVSKSPLSAKKNATKVTMKKHACKKATKSHTIKVALYVTGNKNYAAAYVTKKIKVTMK